MQKKSTAAEQSAAFSFTSQKLSGSILYHNRTDRAYGLAVSAVQAVALVDNGGDIAEINTVLRTCRAAGLTTDTAVINEVSLLCLLGAAKGKGCSFNRLFGKVKPFAFALVKLKNGQNLS